LRRGFSVLRSRYPSPSPKGRPAHSMFLAALWSRCRLVPHSGHRCQRTDKPLDTSTPQPEHVWLVNAGLTATTRLPAHAALWVRMLRNAAHPASLMLLARWWFLT